MLLNGVCAKLLMRRWGRAKASNSGTIFGDGDATTCPTNVNNTSFSLYVLCERRSSSSKYVGKVLAVHFGSTIVTGTPPHATNENAIAIR